MDSDDQFSEEVIEEILKNDKSDDADIICFNWANSKNDNSTKRTDLSLFGGKLAKNLARISSYEDRSFRYLHSIQQKAN